MKNNQPAQYNRVIPVLAVALMTGLGCKTTTSQPYLTTQSPMTLVSSNDGEYNQLFQLTDDQTTDWELKTKDSFTVIHLGPDHPPIIKTVYDTVPCTIYGTPTMAMSSDGRYALIANHSWRPENAQKLKLPAGPQTNADLTPEMLKHPKMTAQRVNMLSLIDLSTPEYGVVNRVLFDDRPMHVLAHPDGQRFITGGDKNFYVHRIENGKLVQLSQNPQPHDLACFWIHPKGHRLIATQGDPLSGAPATVQWYSIQGNRIEHLSEVKVASGVPTKLLDTSFILRISPDGKQALICQRSSANGIDHSDILFADLTLKKPVINAVIKQVSDGSESFAFHPNGKMAVATALGTDHNCIVVLDIASNPPRLLYTLDTKGRSQGIEFTPEGDKLFVGSPMAGRIEVFDVLGEYQLRKNPKFLNIGFGHNSLTVGPRYQPTKDIAK
jgi:WD40 repeat protein